MMLNVVISDDQIEMVNYIKKMIEDIILIDEMLDVKIELVTTNPNEVLELFTFKGFESVENGKRNVISMPFKQRLLFLDINFGPQFAPFDGINLGFEIRKYDISSNIIFITNNSEERRDVIDQKILPLGYLPKRLSSQDLRERITDLIQTARARMYMSTIHKKMIELKIGHGRKRYINLADIYYIKGNESKSKEGSTEKGLALLSEKEGTYSLRRKLKDYADELEDDLVRLGRSYLINPLNVRETKVSARSGILTLANGEEISVLRKSFDDYEEVVSKMRKDGLM